MCTIQSRHAIQLAYRRLHPYSITSTKLHRIPAPATCVCVCIAPSGRYRTYSYMSAYLYLACHATSTGHRATHAHVYNACPFGNGVTLNVLDIYLLNYLPLRHPTLVMLSHQSHARTPSGARPAASTCTDTSCGFFRNVAPMYQMLSPP